MPVANGRALVHGPDSGMKVRWYRRISHEKRKHTSSPANRANTAHDAAAVPSPAIPPRAKPRRKAPRQRHAAAPRAWVRLGVKVRVIAAMLVASSSQRRGCYDGVATAYAQRCFPAVPPVLALCVLAPLTAVVAAAHRTNLVVVGGFTMMARRDGVAASTCAQGLAGTCT
jgi:hypothetical protein